MGSSSGKSARSRLAICSGLHDTAQRPSAVPPPDPPHIRGGHSLAVRPGDRAGQPVLHIRPQRIIHGGLRGLRPPGPPASVPLCRHNPVFQRPAPGRGVAAQLPRDRRRRPARRPRDLKHAASPGARRIAISARSANGNERSDCGAWLIGGIPPASRNHRVTTGRDTPASTAASSLGSHGRSPPRTAVDAPAARPEAAPATASPPPRRCQSIAELISCREMNRESAASSRCAATMHTHLLVIQANGHTGSKVEVDVRLGHCGLFSVVTPSRAGARAGSVRGWSRPRGRGSRRWSTR
jgi:hypothetical protein